MKRKPEGRRVVNITHKHQRSCSVPMTICLWTVAVTTAAFGRSVLEFFRYFLSLSLPSNCYHDWSCPTAQVLVLVFCFVLFSRCGNRSETLRKRTGERKTNGWFSTWRETSLLSYKHLWQYCPQRAMWGTSPPGSTQHLCYPPSSGVSDPIWELMILAGFSYQHLSALRIVTNWNKCQDQGLLADKEVNEPSRDLLWAEESQIFLYK